MVALICFLLQLQTGCQRDDICPASTSTTPLLTVSFFDATERDIPKPPTNLRVKAADFDSIYLDRVNLAEISIPLRTNVNATEYEFILNAQTAPTNGENIPADNSNTDIINFTYIPEQVYINRACSFKVNFLELAANLRTDSNNWIRTIEVITVPDEEDPANETVSQIFIYH